MDNNAFDGTLACFSEIILATGCQTVKEFALHTKISSGAGNQILFVHDPTPCRWRELEGPKYSSGLIFLANWCRWSIPIAALSR
jgi:hypothetical protein